MSFSEYRGSEEFQNQQSTSPASTASETYAVGGVTYSVETGLPVQVTDGPPSITSQVPVGTLPGTSFQNQLYPLTSEPYVLWSNPEGTSWSIREPEQTDLGGSGFSLDGGITSTPGNTVVTDGITVLGYENVLSDDEIKDGIEIIKDKTGNENIIGDGTPEETPSYETFSEYRNRTGNVDPEQLASVNDNDSTDQVPFDLKFGKVDKIIKKLSLRNLVYPIDADFGNTQDYMQINQFKYRPPNQDLFFGNRKTKDQTKNDFDDLLIRGVPLGSPQEEFLGLVKLPMPNSLADSNNVSWGADQLNALTAAVSSAVFGQGQETLNDFTNLFSGEGFKDAGIFGKLGQILKTTGGRFQSAFNDGREGGTAIVDQLTKQGSQLNVLGQAVAGSALLNIGQFGITPETILGRGQGVVPNNNLALLFNSPTLREFTFSWKMTPRSREEAQRVRNIIRFFKQGMAPKKGINTATGAASYFLGTPNVFDIVFKTTRDQYGILNENDAVLRIKTCACTGAAVNYTPDGMWNAYEKGQPVSVTLSLRFSELEPIFDTDYDENEFNYSPNRPDLRPVPIDAIGY